MQNLATARALDTLTLGHAADVLTYRYSEDEGGPSGPVPGLPEDDASPVVAVVVPFELGSMVELGLGPSVEVTVRDPDMLAELDAVEDDEPDEGPAMADGRDDEAGQRWDGEDTGVGERRVAGDDGTGPEARAQVVSSLLTVFLSSTLLVLSLCSPLRSHPSPCLHPSVVIPPLSPASRRPTRISPPNQAVPFQTDWERESPSVSRSMLGHPPVSPRDWSHTRK
ncbi:hypothetical protein V8D89_011267 [Ganoderma adspersum]